MADHARYTENVHHSAHFTARASFYVRCYKSHPTLCSAPPIIYSHQSRFLPSPSRPVGPSTRCSCMRSQTSGVRLSKSQRTVPLLWRSSTGGRSTPVRSLRAGGFSTNTPTTMDASTSWRRENTASLMTGVPSVLRSSPSGASLRDFNSTQMFKENYYHVDTGL